MAGLIPIGKLETASDVTTGAVIRQNGSDSQLAVDARAHSVASTVIAESPEVTAAAAAAAEEAISAAGDRTFFRTDGAVNQFANGDFAVEPSSSSSVILDNWYQVNGTTKAWVAITDGPDGATRVVRVTAPNDYFRQRVIGFGSKGLAGKELIIRMRARAVTVGAETSAPIRVTIARVSPAGTLLDTRVGGIPSDWVTRDVPVTIPADIGEGAITFSFAVHGSNPAGSGQIEFESIRMFVPSEDLPTVVRREMSAAIAEGGVGAWEPAVVYPVGSVVQSAAGHRLRAVEAHTSAARFTDDLAKWAPVDAPSNEAMLLGRARLGHGQRIGVGNRCVFALRFDDWHIAFRDSILPLLTARGIPAGLASISDLTAQPWAAGITGADVRGWNRQGIEIMSHGLDHKDPSPFDLMGAGGLYDQIVGSKVTIESWGVHCRGWMQPGATALIPGVTPYGTGFSDWASLEQYAAWLIRDNYPVSEMYVWGANSRPAPHGLFHGADHVTISDGMTFANVMATLEQRKLRGENLEMMIHSGNLGQGANMTVAEFVQVLDWLVTERDAGRAELLTPSGLFFADRTEIREQAIRNGGFASADGWSNIGGGRTVETGAGHDGPGFLRFSAAETQQVTQAMQTLDKRGWDGHTFVVRGWARTSTGTATARVTLTGGDLAIDVGRSVGTAWTPIYVPFTFPPGVTTVTLGLGRNSGAQLDWDDVSVTPV